MENPEKARFIARYFKTGPGEYGEGDRFVGLTVPVVRSLAKGYSDLSLLETVRLLQSPIHEARLLALLVMVGAWKKADDAVRGKTYQAYLDNTARINNWDLVDASAGHIVGAYLWNRDRGVLDRLATSELVWDRRISIMATSYFIKEGQFTDTLEIARILMTDHHDLIHKAVGWMLREVGKRDQGAEEEFLKLHCRQMPRTMLRYAIERFPDDLRRYYMAGTRSSG
jgi:3-methyladenine DNA glycosylase AlkD